MKHNVNEEAILASFVEVELERDEDNRCDEAFLKIKETLTRIGIASHKEKTLYQSCHILHKKGRYYIVHFLEMFLLDGKESHFSEEDMKRRNTIATLLEEWGLLKVIDKEKVKDQTTLERIKIVHYKDKSSQDNLNGWNLKSKYNIGNK